MVKGLVFSYFRFLLVKARFVAQFNAIFVAMKLQLQNCACKSAAISVRFY